MADSVQYRLEKIADEIEEISKLSVFSKSELNAIIDNRRKHEYNLHRRQPKRADFLAYIVYETNLEMVILNLIKKQKLNKKKKKANKVRYLILSRINYLYLRMLHKFYKDESLWVHYFNWCKNKNCTKKLGKGLLDALELHPNNVDFWIIAASWQLEHNRSPSLSRALFQKGLRFNKNSKKLWLEYFKMELIFAKSALGVLEADNLQKEAKSGQILEENLIIPKIIFDEVVNKRIPGDISHVMEYMDTTVRADLRSKTLLNHILNHLRKEFPNDPKSIFTLCSINIRNADTNSRTYPFILKEFIEDVFNKIKSSQCSAELLNMLISYLIDIKEKCTEKNLSLYLDRKINLSCKLCIEKRIPITRILEKLVGHIDSTDYNGILHVSLESGEESASAWVEGFKNVNDAVQFERLINKALECVHDKKGRALIWKEYFSRINCKTHMQPESCDNIQELEINSCDDSDSDESDNFCIKFNPSQHKAKVEPPYISDKFIQFIDEFQSSNVDVDEIVECYVTHYFNTYGEKKLDVFYNDMINRFKILQPILYDVYTHIYLQKSQKTSPCTHVRQLWLSAISYIETSFIVNYEKYILIWIAFIKFELFNAKNRSNALEVLARARMYLKSSPEHLHTLESLYLDLLKQYE